MFHNEAIRLDPNLALAWNKKGFALKAIGRNTESDAAFAKARELGYTECSKIRLVGVTCRSLFLFLAIT